MPAFELPISVTLAQRFEFANVSPLREPPGLRHEMIYWMIASRSAGGAALSSQCPAFIQR
jgi:hypothetical protein